jgi:hypothetical protein
MFGNDVVRKHRLPRCHAFRLDLLIISACRVGSADARSRIHLNRANHLPSCQLLLLDPVQANSLTPARR